MTGEPKRRPGRAGPGRAPLDPRLLRAVPALRGAVAGWAGLSTLGALAAVAQAAALAGVVSTVMAGRAGPGRLSGPLAVLVAAMAVRAGAAAAGEWLGQNTSLRVRAALRQRLLEAVTRAGARDLDREDRGRVAAASTSGIDSLDGYITRAVPALVGAAVTPPLLLAAIGWTSWLAVVLLLVTLPLVPLFMALIGMATRRHMDRRWAQLAGLSGQFLDLLEGLTTLKIYGRSRAQVAAVRDGTERLRRQTLATLRVAFASGLALDLLATLSVALVAVTVGLELDHGRMGLTAALTVLLLAPEVFAPIRAVGAQHHATEEGRTVISTVLDLLERTPRPGTGPARPFVLRADPTGVVVRLAGVEAGYPGRSGPVLSGVDLAVRAGELTVLTGSSGAGKTTLLSVLLGQLRQSAGSLTVGADGSPRPEGDSWSAGVAWLPQRPRLTCPDVATEVRLGDPDLPDDELDRLLADCAAPPPATLLGEDGRAVSAGQRRRVALARALARAGRVARSGGVALVLLDEPTEDLDPVTAGVVRRVVAGLAGWAAVVAATHDPDLIGLAATEVTVEAGRLQVRAGARRGRPSGVAPRRPGAEPGSVPALLGARGPEAAVPPPAAGGRRLYRWVIQAMGSSPGAARRLAQAGALGSLAGLSGLALTTTSVWLICRASQHPNVQALAIAVVGVRTFAIAKALLRYGERLAAHDGALRLLAGLRVRVFSALEPLAPAGLGDYRRGDLLRRFTSDVDGAQEALVRAAVPLAGAAATAAGAVVLAGMLVPAAGLLLAAGTVAAWATAPLAGRAGSGTAPEAAAAAGRRDALANGLVDGLDELTAYGATTGRREEIAAADRVVAGASRRSIRAAAWGTAATGLVSAATLGGVLLAGSAAVAAGRLPGVDLGVLAAAVLVVFDGLGALPASFAALGRCASGLARVEEVLDRPAPVPEPARPAVPPAAVARLGGRGLVVAPAPGAPAVIDGADLNVDAGERIALVGPSGSGKSTLLSALLGQLAPRRGRIDLSDGSRTAEVTALAGDARPRLVAGSLQGDHVFSTTLRDNLRVVAPAATDADLDRVAARAGLGPFVASLPEGWSTQAGPGGASLSGGQRQRLLLARALLADPEVLVLDEPTAHLDAATEAQVMADLLDATTGRTVVISTHRTAPLERCDRVLGLSGGRMAPVPAGVAEAALAPTG